MIFSQNMKDLTFIVRETTVSVLAATMVLVYPICIVAFVVVLSFGNCQ